MFVKHRNQLTQYTLKEHQWILSKTTESIVSEISFIMVVYEKFFLEVFEAYLINKQIVFQNNIIEKYYKIGRSELC